MDTKRLFELIDKVKNGTATPAELAEYDARMNQLTATSDQWDVGGLGDKAELHESIRAKLMERISPVPVKRLWTWPRIAAAASILVACSIGGYYVLHHKQDQATQLAKTQPHDIAPGHNQATLTLANGKKIVLIKGLSGLLATQGKTSINASGNTIVYNASKEKQLVSYNTLNTARGEQSPYPLVLPDGSKVWLNAESSITFPTAFNGKTREVKVTGEAYFEVKHNASQLFKVIAGSQTIEDIGTQFNVNTYADEQPATTLIEGAVKVNGALLKPGQQSNGQSIHDVDAEHYVAWKNGDFDFEGDHIQTIMRQLARWYDIDVSYQGAISNKAFYASISRQRNISAVLKLLAQTQGIHFKIEGRRITVSE